MKLKIKAVLLVVVLGLSIFLWTGQSLAATGEMYLTPAANSVEIGSNLTVSLRINPGTSVNAVQATVNYNSSDLQFISSNVSAFSTCVLNAGGGGTITISCASLGSSTSSDSLISTISFSALVGSGSSSLTLTNANAANNGVYTDPSTANATVSFTSPQVQTPPASTGSSGTTQTASSTPKSTTSTTKATTPAAVSATPAATPATTTTTPAPKIAIKDHVSSAQFNKVAISISTTTPVKSYIAYGLNKDSLTLSTTPTPLETTTTVSLDPTQLTPGTTYYYQVVSTDASGNVTKSNIQTVSTKGYNLQVTVLDSKYRPVANQVVTLHSVPTVAKTNSQGVATFTNVAPGMHHIIYQESKSTTVSEPLYVDNNFTTKGNTQTAAGQSAAVILTSYKQPAKDVFLWWILVIIVLIVLVFESLLTHGFKALRRRLSFASAMSKRYSVSQIADIEKSLSDKRHSSNYHVKSHSKS
jgi:hypothetical protein